MTTALLQILNALESAANKTNTAGAIAETRPQLTRLASKIDIARVTLDECLDGVRRLVAPKQ